MRPLLIITLFTFFLACNPYEEGPSISLRTKKSRITNTWITQNMYLDNILMADPKATSYGSLELTFLKDGFVRMKQNNIDSVGGVAAIERNGLWQFQEDGLRLLLLFDTDQNRVEGFVWDIVKLTKEEFWFRFSVGNELVEYQMVVKP